MNWPLFAMMALVLLIIIVIAITVILFIRHWANRSTKALTRSDNEGTYFVRYVPPDDNKVIEDISAKPVKRSDYRKPTQYILSTVFAIGLVGLLGAATYTNRDKLAAPIELSDQEVSTMSVEQHTWSYQEFQQLPELHRYLTRFKAQKKGLLLIHSGTEDKWPRHEGNLAQQGEKHWLQFAKRHQLAVNTCTWQELEKCHKSGKSWLHILLPGLWDKAGIQALTESGKHILLYGPPQQVITDSSATFAIAGLTFKGGLTPDSPDLALRGDAELTLGFDAGMIIAARPSFKHFQAESTHPQATAINRPHMAGGEMTTRLYAQAYKNGGRLIWMDFSPNPQDHDKVIPYYLETVVAAIFRYIEGKSYTAWSTWPQGKKFAALLEEDTEDQYHNAQQVAAYFYEKNYPITWFALSENAKEHRDLTRFLAQAGEIACHGDNHMDFPRYPLALQQQRLARCIKVLETLTGKKVTAFRPPREAYNQHTLSAMYNTGIRHFIAETATNRFTPSVYGNSKEKIALISLPRMNVDDYTLWGKMRTSDRASLIQLKQEVDWIKHIGGLFIFSFHTQYMGNAKHLQTIKDIADYVYTNQAYFATAGDIARWWRFRIELMAGQQPSGEMIKKYRPVLITVNAAGELRREAINTPAAAHQKTLAMTRSMNRPMIQEMHQSKE